MKIHVRSYISNGWYKLLCETTIDNNGRDVYLDKLQFKVMEIWYK